MFGIKNRAIGENRLIFNNRSLFALIVPLIVEQILSVFVGLADTVMISSTGEAAVSAISLIENLLFLFISLFNAIATGGAVVTGQYIGKKDISSARSSSSQLLLFSALAGIVIAVLMSITRSNLITLLFGSLEPDVYAHSNTYMAIVTLSIPFLAVFSAAAAVFRTMGNSKLPMLSAICMNIINVVGNAVLIYGFKMDVVGAAIPTLISRAFACILLLFLLYKSPSELRLKGNISLRIKPQMLKKILSIGIPNGIESSSFQLGKLLLLSAVSTLGTASITANAITNNISIINIVPGISLSMAALTVVSRCIGAGDVEQARYYTRRLMFYSYAGTALLSLLIYLFLDPILTMYNLTPETFAITQHTVSVHCLGAFVMWATSFQLPNTLRAAGDARFTMTVSMFSMWVFRLIGGYVLMIPLGLGVPGLWYAMMIDWTVRSIFFVTRYIGTRWLKRKVV